MEIVAFFSPSNRIDIDVGTHCIVKHEEEKKSIHLQDLAHSQKFYVSISDLRLEIKLRKKWNAQDLESENWLQISKDEIFKIGFKHCSAFPLQERVQLNAIVH